MFESYYELCSCYSVVTISHLFDGILLVFWKLLDISRGGALGRAHPTSLANSGLQVASGKGIGQNKGVISKKYRVNKAKE